MVGFTNGGLTLI